MSTSKDAEKFMPKLLDLVRKAKSKAVTSADDDGVVTDSFKEIEDELETMKDMLPRVKLWEKNMSNQFTAVERRLYKIILGTESNLNGALGGMLENVKQLKVLMPTVQSMPCPPAESSSESSTHWSQPELALPADQKMSKEWAQLNLEAKISDGQDMDNMRCYERLQGTQLRLCFLSLSIFPEDSVIKKRPLIYWWIGEGFVTSRGRNTAEEVGEKFFKKLLTFSLIQPHDVNASLALVNSCTMHPWIRRLATSWAVKSKLFDFNSRWPRMPSNTPSCRRAFLLSDNPISEQGDHNLGPNVNDLSTVFNVNEYYLSFKPEWLSKLKKVEVLQLGRWQNSPTHHIDVDDDRFLRGLGPHNMFLKYLSLCGISGITQLPSSILNLISLEILDLRACHNLETLPSDITSLRKLTHLDLSECYLLESIPKGIEKLSSLQVLKGFLIGSLENTPCRLGNLSKLRELRRLSIHMGNEAVVQEGEFGELGNISSLRRLKISWGVVSPKLKPEIASRSLEIAFPWGLEKLDLQGIPLEDAPWLKPSNLICLKKLYIRGGELGRLEPSAGDVWGVEILRLKYLRRMEIGLEKLLNDFPLLLYLEKIKCHEITNDSYDQDIVWARP